MSCYIFSVVEINLGDTATKQNCIKMQPRIEILHQITSQIGDEMFLVRFNKKKIIVTSLKGVSDKLPCEKSECSWQI